MDIECRNITVQQELFCQEFAVDRNGTQAAIRAGYAKRSARGTAARLLAKPDIQARVEEIMAAIVARVGVTQDMVVSELCKLAFTNVTDVVDVTGKEVRIRTPLEVDESKWAAVASVSETKKNRKVTRTIKMHDKKAALELLGRYLNMFNDKSSTQVSGEVIHKIERVMVSPGEGAPVVEVAPEPEATGAVGRTE